MNNFGNNNSKNNSLENTNTRGISFFNSKAEFKSALVLGFWNEMVSFRWHPPLPEEQRTEKKIFNYEESVSTCLGYTKLAALIKGIKEKIIPALNSGVKRSIGVPISDNTSALIISSGEDGANPYIGIYKDLSEDRIPGTQMIYIFDKGIIINDYDPKTGECNVTSDPLYEFNAFVNYLESCLIGLCSATCHSIRYGDRYFRDKLIGGNSSNSGYTKKSNNVWGDTNINNSQSDNSYMAETQTYKNVDELEEFM